MSDILGGEIHGVMKMRLPFSLKMGATAIVIAVVLLAAGVYVGAFYWEREGIRKGLEESVLRTALNLQTIGYIREGKSADAVALLDSMNSVNLAYLMRYDDVESENPDFIRRKKKVLAALSKEWADHPRKDSSFKSDPQWQQYQDDLKRYLEQNR